MCLAKQLIPLMKHDKSSYPSGPRLQFYSKLTLPFILFGCLVVALKYILSESQGLAMLLGIMVLMYRIWVDGHRLVHMSQWPCPSQLGGYFGGQLQLLLCFLFHILPIIYRDYMLLLVLPIVVVAPVYIFLCIKIGTADPGFVFKSDVRDSVSGEYTTRDIALGHVPPRRFCTDCEIIQPLFTKHCRLCERCVLRLDHHCLFFMRCIGKNNHCAFVYYTLITILGGLLFLASVYAYGLELYPENLIQIFSKEGWIMGCVYLTLITIAMSVYVLKWQFSTIAKGETWAFFSQAPVSGLTAGEKIMNIFYFMTGRFYLKCDPLFDIENPKTVKMHD